MSPRENAWYSLYPACGGLKAPASLNDFFPGPWLARTPVRNFALRCHAVAPVTVRVVVYDEAPIPRLLVEVQGIVDEAVIRLPCLTECGRRVSFEVESADSDTVAPSASIRCEWVCDTPPLQKAVLGLAICTMNRELQIKTLLDQCLDQSESFKTCVVVNQGESGLKNRLGFSQLAGHVEIFDQINYGGAGGFSRGILEVLEHPDVTHIVLMDDDVEIDVDLLSRVLATLSYLPPNVCLGGQMLNVADTSEVLSLGHKFDSTRAITTDFGGQLPTASNFSREWLEQSLAVDFCGWWFFCFPRAATDICGFPLPLFLRGDDTEYGLRLKRSGFPTLMWPGIQVSHPRLTEQTRAWHVFYDRRNALICAALLDGYVSSRAMMRTFRGVLNATVLFKYAEARAGLLAIEMFLGGRAALDAWSPQHHQQLVRDSDPVYEKNCIKECHLLQYRYALIRTVITITRLFADVIDTRKKSRSEPLVVTAVNWTVGIIRRPRRVWVVTDQKMTLLEKDPSQARAILRRLIVLIGPIMRRRSVEHQSLLSLGTRTWWNKRLGRI